MSWRASLVAAVLAAAVVPSLSYAQNQDNGGGGNNGGGRRQRNNDNGGGGGGGGQGQRGGDWQQRRMEQAKERLGVTDDEWKVIEPKVNKVMEAQRETMSGMFGGRGMGRPGGGGGNDQAPTTKLGKATADLRQATEGDASPEDVEKKLAAYREARATAQASLEAARKDLKEVLTPKQEAMMVLASILE